MRCVISLLSKLYMHALWVHNAVTPYFLQPFLAPQSTSILMYIPCALGSADQVYDGRVHWLAQLVGERWWEREKRAVFSATSFPRLAASLGFLPCFNGKLNKVRVFFCCSLFWRAAQQGPIPRCCSKPAGPAVPTWTFVSHSGHSNLIETSYFTPLLPWNHVDMFQKYKLGIFLPFLSPSESKLNEKSAGDGRRVKKNTFYWAEWLRS